MSQIEDLEKLGIHFDFKDLRNGELVERTHYHRRDNRQTRNHKLDNRMIGMVKKTKKESQATRRRLNRPFKKIVSKNVSLKNVIKFEKQSVNVSVNVSKHVVILTTRKFVVK